MNFMPTQLTECVTSLTTGMMLILFIVRVTIIKLLQLRMRGFRCCRVLCQLQVVTCIGKSRPLVVSSSILMLPFCSLYIIHICIGICKRDDGGAFFLAKIMNFSPLCSVPIGEALCLFNAIKWLSDMHMHSVDFVVDSKTNNVTFHSKLPDVSKFGHIISGCQRLFHSHFANFLVGGVQQATNKYYSPCFS